MQVLKIAIFVMVANGLIGMISLPHPTKASNIEVAGIYSASMTGDSEIPEVNTRASGEASFESNAQAAALGDAAAAASSGSQLTYEITLQNIEKVTAAHIHSGDGNENGPIVVTLFDPDTPTGAINGELVRSIITADDLEGPLENKQISDLVDLFESGQAYVNVHTQTNPNGEIRGTILQG